jgi:hypothetical protein
MTGPSPRPDALPAAGVALAVCAHPDDETFGLGGVLAALVDAGTAVDPCASRAVRPRPSARPPTSSHWATSEQPS